MKIIPIPKRAWLNYTENTDGLPEHTLECCPICQSEYRGPSIYMVRRANFKCGASYCYSGAVMDKCPKDKTAKGQSVYTGNYPHSN